MPASLTDAQLEGAAKYRIGGRLPTLVARCSYSEKLRPKLRIRHHTDVVSPLFTLNPLQAQSRASGESKCPSVAWTEEQ